jgi:hypothetical protein
LRQCSTRRTPPHRVSGKEEFRDHRALLAGSDLEQERALLADPRRLRLRDALPALLLAALDPALEVDDVWARIELLL